MSAIWQDIKSIIRHPQKGMMKLIIANVFVFLLLILLKVFFILNKQTAWFDELLAWFTLSNQYKQVYSHIWTLLTYSFVHTEIFHLLFNMVFLYWFGNILTDFIGEKRLVQWYLLGGIAGGIAYLLISNSLSYFIMKGPGLLNGASASIYAIVVAAATIRPNYRVSLLFFGSVAIKYISLFYVIWSIIETTGGNGGGNIAHLGGALMGYLFGLNFKRNWVVHEKEKPKVYSFVGSLKNEFIQKQENDRDDEEVEEDELNEILDKISKSGYESLSKFEKRRLFKASQKNN
jgi:membrane associated rhomboid family serine protease